jgi:hypothetical protein
MHPSNRTVAAPAVVLPLALTPFEVYYDLDDSAAHPTTFPFELKFSGRIDRRCFSTALAETLARHPLLLARIEDTPSGPRWVACDEQPPLDWADEGVPLSSPDGDRIDLRRGVGWRTYVRVGENHSRVLFQVHHACCDGLAALQVAQEFLARYRMAAGYPQDESLLRPVDAALLERRGVLAGDEPVRRSLWAPLRDGWYTLKVWASILFRRTEVLQPPRQIESEQRALLSYEVAELGPEETAALRAAASQLNVTVNDLLLRDLLLVLRDWNAEQAGIRSGRLRINVPVNVRARAEAAMPAANRIGYGFVTVNVGAGDDPRTVLDAVREETGRIKRWYLAHYFLGGLAFARSVPGMLAWMIRRKRSFATAVLSNVSRFAFDPVLPRDAKWQCGDLTLEWIGGVPPFRELTRAAIIAIEYGGRLSLCLRTDPHHFDQASTRALLKRFAERVCRTSEARD